jgi:dTDP-4-amino-4,6-dideoxygalactose transaminase
MNCGEGGALATNNAKIYEMASSFHSFGRRKGKPWYAHYYLAWNHRITALQSALLLGELQRLEKQTLTRATNGALLNEGLSQIVGQSPQVDGDTHAGTRRAFHVYLWRYDAKQVGLDRDTFMEALKAEGVDCFGVYPLPLQEAPMFTERRYWHAHRLGGGPTLPGEPNYRAMKTPVTKRICKEAVWLTHNYLLGSRKEMQGIVDAVARIVEHAPELKKAKR